MNEKVVYSPVFGKTGKIVKMWMEFEESLFELSRIDGKLSMNDFWEMSVYDFMRYKALLKAHNKRKIKAK